MNFAPYQWRAKNGYLPPPDSKPAPIFNMAYQPMAAMPFGYYPGAPALPAWAPSYPGNPCGPVLSMPPCEPKSGKKAKSEKSSAPPKPPSVNKIDRYFETIKMAAACPDASVHDLGSVSFTESSPATLTFEDYKKWCDATMKSKKERADESIKAKKLKEAKELIKKEEEEKKEKKKKEEEEKKKKAEEERKKKAEEEKKKKKKIHCSCAGITYNGRSLGACVCSETGGSTKKDDDAKSETHASKTNSYAPPTIRPGVNYLFPPKKEHTMLHVFNKSSKIWDDKYKGDKQQFKIFRTPTLFTPTDIIQRVRGNDAEKCKDWAMTEVVEGGEGTWKKGTTIEYGSDKAKGTLASMGWDAKRGEGRPPVWVVVHKK